MGKRTPLAEVALVSFFFAAFLAAEAVRILEEIDRLAPPTQTPAWLTAHFDATVSRADPEEPQ